MLATAGGGAATASASQQTPFSATAIAIEGFDREAVTRALEQRGLTPDQNLDYGFYVRDPEGIPVQIVGT